MSACPRSAITFVRPEQLSTKAPYAYAAVTAPGQLVFTAGACPLDGEGNTVAVGDVTGQARQVMDSLVPTLHAAGALLSDALGPPSTSPPLTRGKQQATQRHPPPELGGNRRRRWPGSGRSGR